MGEVGGGDGERPRVVARIQAEEGKARVTVRGEMGPAFFFFCFFFLL